MKTWQEDTQVGGRYRPGSNGCSGVCAEYAFLSPWQRNCFADFLWKSNQSIAVLLDGYPEVVTPLVSELSR